MSHAGSTRRDFLRGSSGVLAATWFGAHWPALAAAAEHAHEAASGTIDHTFHVLTPAQARDVEAIASQIVPSGDTPGAREAGVVYFIDHVHAGIFKSGAPEFLAGLTAFQQGWAEAHPGAGPFADAVPEAQIEHLQRVETTPFFQGMRFLTVTGLLSNPSYGGNEHKLGWKLVGFVDQHAWQPPFGYYDAEYTGFVPYDREPRS
ncbi:MAG: gluconate 2-dehydrogenase subunit 3 family protein [Steroidobacteraceae bacterium]